MFCACCLQARTPAQAYGTLCRCIALKHKSSWHTHSEVPHIPHLQLTLTSTHPPRRRRQEPVLPAPGVAAARRDHACHLAAPEPHPGPGPGRASALACVAACLTLSQRGHLASKLRGFGQCATPAQVAALEALGIPALALTSLTPKEEVATVYERLDSDTSLRLVYGTRPIARRNAA